MGARFGVGIEGGILGIKIDFIEVETSTIEGGAVVTGVRSWRSGIGYQFINKKYLKMSKNV